MDIQQILFALMELVGVGLAIIGVIMGTIKGRHALKLTGGGIIEHTVTYLLIAAYLYLIQYGVRFVGHMLEEQWIESIGTIVLFGTGICFFMLFKKIGEHMKQLEALAED